MMFGSRPRNSGLWNFHNPDFSFFFFALDLGNSEGCSFWTHAPFLSLLHIQTWINGKMLARALAQTYTFTHNYKHRQGRHVRLQTDRHLDAHTLVEHCVRLYPSSPKFLMTLLWSYWNDLRIVTHTHTHRVMREWLCLVEPAWALRLWYKRLPYCLTSSVNIHTYTHFQRELYKPTRWLINSQEFVKRLWFDLFSVVHLFFNHVFTHALGKFIRAAVRGAYGGF